MSKPEQQTLTAYFYIFRNAGGLTEVIVEESREKADELMKKKNPPYKDRLEDAFAVIEKPIQTGVLFDVQEEHLFRYRSSDW